MGKAKMDATYAVLGFVSDHAAKSYASGTFTQAIEVRTQRGSDQEVVRVPADAVAGVLTGASSKGETSVQVLLKDGAKVETLTRGLARDLHMRLIPDLSVITTRPPINVIFIDPTQTQFLTAPNVKK